MRTLTLRIATAALALSASAFGYAWDLPENPTAVQNCAAKIKVDAARFRAGPSLSSRVLGVLKNEESVFVTRVEGKWVQVVTSEGDTAYMAAYLLSFPYHEILEQWKRSSPPPTVGKKAKVKWAGVNLRQYPSKASPRVGRFVNGDEVGVLADLGNGWSLVESRASAGEKKCFGFIANRALATPDVPDPPEWVAPLARVRAAPGDFVEPALESAAQYAARTAWSPELFAMELQGRTLQDPSLDELGGDRVAVH